MFLLTSLIDETRTNAMIVVNNILKRVTKNPVSNTPQFPIGSVNVLDDAAVQIVNIGDNITAGGKFKPSKDGGLIQKKTDLAAFNTLFGSYKNAKNTIYNVLSDLADIVSRDNFYTQLLKDNSALLAKGERALFYPTYNAALKKLPYQEVTEKGLKLTTRFIDYQHFDKHTQNRLMKILEFSASFDHFLSRLLDNGFDVAASIDDRSSRDQMGRCWQYVFKLFNNNVKNQCDT